MKTTFLLLMMIISVLSYSNEGAGLEVGDKVPAFKATADDGTVWNSKNHIGDKYLVVYFYPGAMTGGCTKQACAYRDYQTNIEKADAMVVGISGDNVEGLQLFKNTYDLNFTLLSDESGKVANIFGVPTRDGAKFTKEVDGMSYEIERGTTASRWTFIIDKDGKVVYKNEDVDASSDPEDVLNFIKNKS
jgi:peroxiredoxin Q/BCP